MLSDPAADPEQLLLDHLDEADLVQLPPPDEDGAYPPFIPPWYRAPLPALIYPPLAGRGLQEGESINLELGASNVYHGVMRELEVTPDEARGQELARLALEIHPVAGHLFDGELKELPLDPGHGIPPELAEAMPVLIYPPIDAQRPEGDEAVEIALDRGNLFYGMLRDLAETADEERARRLAAEIPRWHPEPAALLCWLGRRWVEADLERALLHYELALELKSACYEALQDGGACALALAGVPDQDRDERLQAAEEYFRAARVLRPDSGLTTWSLARTLHAQGGSDEAVEELEHFLRHYPEGQQRDLVEQALTEGFQEEPRYTEEQVQDREDFQRAAALAFGDDPAEAVRLLEPLCSRHPNEGHPWFMLGAAYRRAGDAAEAERCLRRATRLAPEEPFMWWELGRALLDQTEFGTAESALRRALELDPENAGYLADLARSLAGQGDVPGAAEALRSAYALVPGDPEIEELARKLGVEERMG